MVMPWTMTLEKVISSPGSRVAEIMSFSFLLNSMLLSLVERYTMSPFVTTLQ